MLRKPTPKPWKFDYRFQTWSRTEPEAVEQNTMLAMNGTRCAGRNGMVSYPTTQNITVA